MVEAGMLELILLAIAVALVSAVTHDLVLSGHRHETDVRNSHRHKLTRERLS
jgi:hypothetical protein